MPTFEMLGQIRPRHCGKWKMCTCVPAPKWSLILFHAGASSEMKITVGCEHRQDIYINYFSLTELSVSHTHKRQSVLSHICKLAEGRVSEGAEETDNEKNIDLRMSSAAILTKKIIIGVEPPA